MAPVLISMHVYIYIYVCVFFFFFFSGGWGRVSGGAKSVSWILSHYHMGV